MTDLAKKLREDIDMDAATATDAEWSNLLATAMDVRDALEREPDEATVERDALYFYADHDNWLQSMWLPTAPCLRDEGVIARAALAAMKEGRQ